MGLDNPVCSGGRSVSIDGKTIYGSKRSNHSAYHVVSAWVAENHITLGELAVDEKSNEITAIPELLDMIDVDGDIVTIDAIGCQTDIAAKMRKKGADYVLALKDNQQTLHEDVADYFDWIERESPRSEYCGNWKGNPKKATGGLKLGKSLRPWQTG